MAAFILIVKPTVNDHDVILRNYEVDQSVSCYRIKALVLSLVFRNNIHLKLIVLSK
jgi:hypothetical protein